MSNQINGGLIWQTISVVCRPLIVDRAYTILQLILFLIVTNEHQSSNSRCFSMIVVIMMSTVIRQMCSHCFSKLSWGYHTSSCLHLIRIVHHRIYRFTGIWLHEAIGLPASCKSEKSHKWLKTVWRMNNSVRLDDHIEKRIFQSWMGQCIREMSQI